MTYTEISVLKLLKVISYVFGKLIGSVSTQPQKSFLNKANIILPNWNQNTRKSKAEVFFNYLGEKADKPGSASCTMKELNNRSAPFLPLLGAGCTLPLSASSMGLRYYITQSLKTAPLPRKHQGSWDTAPRYPFLPDTQPSNATDTGPCFPAVSSQRHLPCNCCNPISIHLCSPNNPVRLFYLPTCQANVRGRYIPPHTSAKLGSVYYSALPYPFPIHGVQELKSGFWPLWS